MLTRRSYKACVVLILFRKIKELERIRRLNTIQEVGNEGNDRDDEEMDEGIINHGGLFLEGMDAGGILLGETDSMITGLDTPEWLLSWNNWGDWMPGSCDSLN